MKIYKVEKIFFVMFKFFYKISSKKICEKFYTLFSLHPKV